MNNLTKNLVLWLVIAMVLMAVFNNFAPEQNRAGKEIDYSVFLDEVERGSVEQVTGMPSTFLSTAPLKAQSFVFSFVILYGSQSWGPDPPPPPS